MVVRETPAHAGHTVVVINPVAGGGRGYRLWRAVRPHLERAGWELREVIAAARGAAWQIAEGAAGDASCGRVVVVGGDGTVHEVINGMLRARPDRPPLLAVVPGGTANLLTYTLGIPDDPATVTRMFLDGRTRRIDLGWVQDRYFAAVAGVGFDGEVAAWVNRWRLRRLGTKPMFAAAILGTLISYRPVDCRIHWDGYNRETRMFLLTAANTPWYGGGMHIAPSARLDSGTLEVVIVGDVSRREALAVLRGLFTAGHLRHPKVERMAAAEVHVESAVPLRIQADGESLGWTPVTFRAVPAALEVVVPP